MKVDIEHPKILECLTIYPSRICTWATLLTILQLVVEVGSIGMHWNSCPLVDNCIFLLTHVQGCWCAGICKCICTWARWSLVSISIANWSTHGQRVHCMLTIGRLSWQWYVLSRQWLADRWNASAPPQNWPCQGPSPFPPSYMDKYMLGFRLIYFSIWINTFF